MSQSYAPPRERPTARRGAGERPDIWTELAVEVDPASSCPLAGGTGRGASGSVQLAGSTCHLTLAIDGEEAPGVRTLASPIDERCVCAALCGPGVAPVEMTVEDGTITIGAYVRDRAALAAATDRLDAVAAGWGLRRLSDGRRTRGVGGGRRRDRLDDVRLTDKQREAVRIAVESGYYRRPRETSLGDLAEAIGVSRSALSQRLNAVETKLVRALARDGYG